jgi:hypothetical protein
MSKLRQSSPDAEGVYRASRWLQVAALLETGELKALLDSLPDLQIFATGAVVSAGEETLSSDAYCALYDRYLEAIGQAAIQATIPLTVSLSTCSDCLYVMEVGNGRRLVRVQRPVIGIRPHTLAYSAVDNRFRSMVRGENAIAWGLEFSYPQLFQCPRSGEILAVASSDTFPNTTCFRALQRWMREHTRATPFLVGDRRINVSARLGRQYQKANDHPQLIRQGIQVRQHAS